ncbi:hypothetical protein [Rathayibacter toxicus]|uniref:hypothetical protein n=1 Tax=Rathayibacter toxicus TaxID=145458 RepID=UPI000CE93244|nr:hypothetical protein [Rathayibacter toxicus]PPI56548.1 hypothetical protein C5D35_01695 [Rathayibacter toxicus]QOD10238.1 hypothetical protein BSG36_10060 [Rathayibacter toxicus]QWL28912.1 hypothetical protein E2R33_10080 [Rathayibacter toxicus]
MAQQDDNNNERSDSGVAGQDSCVDFGQKCAPVAPDNRYSRESYAIHATRSELPLFSDALTDRRDDSTWRSSLSRVFDKAAPGQSESTLAAAQAALERRSKLD